MKTLMTILLLTIVCLTANAQYTTQRQPNGTIEYIDVGSRVGGMLGAHTHYEYASRTELAMAGLNGNTNYQALCKSIEALSKGYLKNYSERTNLAAVLKLQTANANDQARANQLDFYLVHQRNMVASLVTQRKAMEKRWGL